MDFFEYASLAKTFTTYDTHWVPYLVGALCYAIVFIFSAVALFTIATREGYKHRWMAFIPFFNTYYIGVCAQKNRCLNLDARRVSLITAILEVLLFTAFVFYYASYELLLSGGFIIESIDEATYGIPMITYYLAGNIPDGLGWAVWCFSNIENVIIWWLQLVWLFFEIMTLSCFFQTYKARRYLLFTITSILFPIQGILFFMVRNNRGMNYREYMMREQERQYRNYQEYMRQNNNPYNNSYNYGQNPYSHGGYNQPPQDRPSGGSSTDEDPFSEFGNGSSGSGGSGGSDPFDLN